jgi:dTDP-4-amino-4,6-dideoxygalactose transaminase
MKIPKVFVTQPYMPPLNEYEYYLRQIWESKELTNNGKFHKQFETELCNYLGVKYISLFVNGTVALITALQALNIKGEVITSPYSFPATTHALQWNGITPVFADIEPDKFSIDPQKIKLAITSKTSAILPVHVYGFPCRHAEINSLAKKYRLKVIYDSAHTFGVRDRGISLCNYGDLSILSFHATKVFNTFEGGAIISHSQKMKEKIDFYKNFGFADETTIIASGINGKMNELQAAFGILQLKYIDEIICKRKKIAKKYIELLENVSGIKVFYDEDKVSSNYSYFPIIIDSKVYGKKRDELYEELKKYNIYTRRYFYPLISNFKMYKGLPSSSKNNLKIANRLSENILCLPIYPELPISVVEKIANIITNYPYSSK